MNNVYNINNTLPVFLSQHKFTSFVINVHFRGKINVNNNYIQGEKMQNRLREFREEKKLSQQKMADQMNKLGYKISKATISMYESGDRTPTEKKWKELAIFFNTNVDTLKGKISNTDEVTSKLINIIHTTFFSKTDTDLKDEITLYLSLTNQINVPHAFYIQGTHFKINKYIHDFWLSCLDFIFKNDNFISSLINENNDSRLKLILQNEIHKYNQKIINKNPNTRYLYEIKTENNKLVNYLLSNYRNLPVVDNLQDVLDLDKIKITNSTYEDITDKNIIETIDEQTSKFNWIKKNLIKEMKATKNDKQ